MAYCEGPKCGDQFHADESSDGRFCSWECREAADEELEQNSQDYDLGYGPRVVRLTDIREAEFDRTVAHIL